MLCVPSHSPKVLSDERGSAVVGFCAIAPLVTLVFVLIVQIATLCMDQVTLSMAANEGARAVATMYSTSADGVVAAKKVMKSRGAPGVDARFTAKQEKRGTVTYVIFTAQESFHIALLNRDISLSSTARVVDEKAL